MHPTTVLFPLLLLLAPTLAIPSTHSTLLTGTSPPWSSIRTIFALGDSYTDTGFRPGNELQPSPSNPLGAPSFDSPKYFLDQRWITHLTTTYNATPNVLTYDLGISASVIDTRLIERASGLNLEVDTWSKYYLDKKKGQSGSAGAAVDGGWDPASTLFAIFIGINDVSISATNETVYGRWDRIFASYADMLRRVREEGARHFLVLGVPSMELAPGAPKKLKEMVPAFNERVMQVVRGLDVTTSLVGDVGAGEEGSVWWMDTAALFRELIADPSVAEGTAGITVKDAQCGDYGGSKPTSPSWKAPGCKGAYDEYFWRDGLHVTGGVHKAIAEAVVSGFGEGSYSWGEEGQLDTFSRRERLRVRNGRWRTRGIGERGLWNRREGGKAWKS